MWLSSIQVYNLKLNERDNKHCGQTKHLLIMNCWFELLAVLNDTRQRTKSSQEQMAGPGLIYITWCKHECEFPGVSSSGEKVNFFIFCITAPGTNSPSIQSAFNSTKPFESQTNLDHLSFTGLSILPVEWRLQPAQTDTNDIENIISSTIVRLKTAFQSQKVIDGLFVLDAKRKRKRFTFFPDVKTPGNRRLALSRPVLGCFLLCF